jgi:hypothetical protein
MWYMLLIAQWCTVYVQVILCGGTVNSPQLLMLSGVGPADELRRHNIQLVHHSPGVGCNLHDHLGKELHYHCTKPVSIYRNVVKLTICNAFVCGMHISRKSCCHDRSQLSRPAYSSRRKLIVI